VDMDDERDKFGRILGDLCDVDGIRLSRALVDSHLAVLYEGQSKDEIANKHLENYNLLEKA